MKNKEEILKYFKDKAESYDLVDEQTYWKLSDDLLWFVFDSIILSKLPKNFKFLDAGGGTGRWSEKILKQYPESQGVIYDLSQEMLSQAKIKKNKLFGERLNLIEGDISDMKEINNEEFDLSFNFHNVLGFVASPKDSLREISRVTKKNGFVVSFIPNLYHNIFFNICLGRLDEAEIALKTNEGRFTKEMPYMHMFTPSSIKNIYSEIGLTDINIIGFPITIYPGYQETQLKGTSEKILNILEGDNFKRIFEIEKELIFNQEIASRGNNLFVAGRKQ